MKVAIRRSGFEMLVVKLQHLNLKMEFIDGSPYKKGALRECTFRSYHEFLTFFVWLFLLLSSFLRFLHLR